MDKETVIDTAEQWVVQSRRSEHGRVPSMERIGTGLLGLGLLMLSRRSRMWGAPVAVVGGAMLARSASGYCPVYDSMGEPRSDTRTRLRGARGQHIREHITVAQPLEAVYGFWRDLSQMDEATRGIVTVERRGEYESHWQLRTRTGGPVVAEWTAELINDVSGKVLGWRTTSEADIVSAGSVTFRPAPAGDFTEVHVHLQYSAPLGWLGTAAATVGGHNPGMLVREALRDIKRYLELGRRVTLTA